MDFLFAFEGGVVLNSASIEARAPSR